MSLWWCRKHGRYRFSGLSLCLCSVSLSSSGREIPSRGRQRITQTQGFNGATRVKQIRQVVGKWTKSYVTGDRQIRNKLIPKFQDLLLSPHRVISCPQGLIPIEGRKKEFRRWFLILTFFSTLTFQWCVSIKSVNPTSASQELINHCKNLILWTTIC